MGWTAVIASMPFLTHGSSVTWDRAASASAASTTSRTSFSFNWTAEHDYTLLDKPVDESRVLRKQILLAQSPRPLPWPPPCS